MLFDHLSLRGEAAGGLPEFSHYAGNYPKGWWRRENEIVLDHCKLNVFVSGEFTLLADNSLYEPMRGDAFLAEPEELHCGNIAKATFIEYYQLDFDMRLIESLPCGKEFTARLLGAKRSAGSFLRTESARGDQLIRLCGAIEEAAARRAYALAFARCVELLSALTDAFESADRPKSVGFSHAVSETIRLTDGYTGGRMSVSEIAEACGVSESYLLRTFKAELGETPSRYLMRKRLAASAAALSENCSVTDTAAQFGFSDASHYIACFRRCFGCTPREYAKRKKG